MKLADLEADQQSHLKKISALEAKIKSLESALQREKDMLVTYLKKRDSISQQIFDQSGVIASHEANKS